MQTKEQAARFDRRVAELYASDEQFAAAKPSPAVTAAAQQPGLRLPHIVNTVLAGYASRPALAQRAVELVRDPQTGRSSARLLPAFETITYAQLQTRVQAVTRAWTDIPVNPGDRVAILGFTSVDYTTIDLALMQLGAVAVPLQTNTPIDRIRPVLAEIEPTLIASSVAHLDEAVQAVLSGPTPARLVVFDFRPEVDEEREALALATARLAEANSPTAVSTLADDIRCGTAAPPIEARTEDRDDPLALLLYTSGSTGAPKGVMYPQGRIADLWRGGSTYWDEQHCDHPAIILSFLPMSHIMGRQALYGSLSAGGTVYFAAQSDLSTFFEDLALVRPTQLVLVPRVWDMIAARVQSQLDHCAQDDHCARDDQDRATAEAEILERERHALLGGRFVNALTGSAPMSSELKDWTESFLGFHLLEGYGSTEAGSVIIDGQIRRPPVTEYKLVDVADLGYLTSDSPYPRGELLIKTEQLFPGYYKRPDVTAAVFDEDGFYRTGDIFAQTGPEN
nr:AMP-binding protein [Actinomycetes bacterium]